MKKLYCVICGKYRTFKNPKTTYTFEKNIINETEKIFKEEESIESLKILNLIKSMQLL